MHYVASFTDRALGAHPVYEGRGHGYRQGALVDHTSGSVHTGLSIAELAGGGLLPLHVHSYEESFYVLSGEGVASINGQPYRLGPGDYGCIKVSTLHGWRNT